MDDFDDGNLTLTNGFFQAFVSNTYSPEAQPILQIIESRVMPGAGIIRLRLSDGLFSYSNCAAGLEIDAQLDRDGFKESHGLIQVTQFVRSMTGDKPGFNIISYKPLQLTNTIVGDPKPHSGNPDEYKGIENFPSLMQQSNGNGFQSPSRKRGLVDQRGVTPNKRQATNLPSGGVFNDGILEVALVTPYVNRFRLCGTAAYKEEPRKINTKRGETKVFSFILTDVAGNSIKIAAFGKECDSYSDLVQNGQAYYITCVGTNVVREANRRYNSSGHTYEITLNEQCKVEACTDRDIGTPGCKLRCIPLLDIKNHPNECVDLLAIIDKVDDISSVIAKATQKNLRLRNVTLIDDSCTQVKLTLWENDMDKITPDMTGSIIGIKGAPVREYNGSFSVSVGSSSSLIMAPDGDRAVCLINWYREKRSTAQVGSLTHGDGSGSVTFARDCRLINTVKEMDEDALERGFYLIVEACINGIKADNVAYNACSVSTCKKKVTLEANQWSCPTHGITDSCRETYILSVEIADLSGLTWITLFDEAATGLIGMSAAELMALQREDRAAYDRIFQQLRFKPYEFRVRAKNEFYNDQKRIRWQCFKAGPVNVQQYTAALNTSLAALC